MRIGLLGGTFNPIHLGHLILAEAAREQARLDEVWFMPTAQPPHKSARDLPDGTTRLAMVRLAVRGAPDFRASDVELRLGGISYTLRTLRVLHQRDPKTQWFFIIGSDMLAVPWRGLPEIAARCTFLVADRRAGPAIGPGPSIGGPSVVLQRAGGRDLRPTRSVGEGATGLSVGLHVARRRFPRMRRIALSEIDISSSMVRERVRQGRSIRYLVPEAVAAYIRRHRLYQHQPIS